MQPAAHFRCMTEVIAVLYQAGTWRIATIPYVTCFVCGDRHLAKNCPHRLSDEVPKNFCVACLLPLWAVDGVGRVHHPKEYGKLACKNNHKETTREIFLRARYVCSTFHF